MLTGLEIREERISSIKKLPENEPDYYQRDSMKHPFTTQALPANGYSGSYLSCSEFQVCLSDSFKNLPGVTGYKHSMARSATIGFLSCTIGTPLCIKRTA